MEMVKFGIFLNTEFPVLEFKKIVLWLNDRSSQCLKVAMATRDVLR